MKKIKLLITLFLFFWFGISNTFSINSSVIGWPFLLNWQEFQFKHESNSDFGLYKNGNFISKIYNTGASNFLSNGSNFQVVYNFDKTKALLHVMWVSASSGKHYFPLLFFDLVTWETAKLWIIEGRYGSDFYLNFHQEGVSRGNWLCYSYDDFSEINCTKSSESKANWHWTQREYQPLLSDTWHILMLSIGKWTSYPVSKDNKPTLSQLINNVWYHWYLENLDLEWPFSFVLWYRPTWYINTNKGAFNVFTKEYEFGNKYLLYYTKEDKVILLDKWWDYHIDWTYWFHIPNESHLWVYWAYNSENKLISVLYQWVLENIWWWNNPWWESTWWWNNKIKCDKWSQKIVEYKWSVYAPLYGDSYQCIAQSDDQTLLDCEFELKNTRNNSLFWTGVVYNMKSIDYDINNLISSDGTGKFSLPYLNDSTAINIKMPSWINVWRVSMIGLWSTSSTVYRVGNQYNVNWLNNQKLIQYTSIENVFARSTISWKFYNTSQEEMAQWFKYVFINDSNMPWRNKVEYNIALIGNIWEWIYWRECCTSNGNTYCDGKLVWCDINDENCLLDKLPKIDDEENRNFLEDWKSSIGTPPTSTWSIIWECYQYPYWSQNYINCINSNLGIPNDQWGFSVLNKVLWPEKIENRNLVDTWSLNMEYKLAEEFVVGFSQNDKPKIQAFYKFITSFLLFIVVIVGVFIIFSPRWGTRT